MAEEVIVQRPGKWLKRTVGMGFSIAMMLAISFGGSAEYVRQPDGWSSSLSASSGPDIYDWQLANMVATWIVPQGFANMIFVFDECYGGGMLDELEQSLQGRGDVAIMSASRHNEVSWFLDAALLAADRDGWSRLGFDRPTHFFGKEVVEEMARLGTAARTMEQIARDAAQADVVRAGGTRTNGSAWGANLTGLPIVEHPQWVELGDGGDVRLGYKSDGQPVESRHAVLFGGKADNMAHWNEIEHIHMVLAQYHGFPEENIHVLIDDGPGGTRPDGTQAPGYVDGPGTRLALWNALRAVGAVMSPNEQFVFWSNNHGNRDRTSLSVMQTIREATRTLIRSPLAGVAADPSPGASGTWDLDQTFLDHLLAVPGNQPYVSLITDGLALDTCGNDLMLVLNGVSVGCSASEDIVTLDDNPDVDGTEFVFPVADESLLGLENTIEIEWVGGADRFSEYTVLGLQICSGAVAVSPTPLPEEEDDVPHTGKDMEALSAAIGARLSFPGTSSLWLTAGLDLPPLKLTNQLDIALLPLLSVADLLELEFEWGWFSITGFASVRLVPWSLVSAGGWIEVSSPQYTFGETILFTVDGGVRWGPQWSGSSLEAFAHGVSGFFNAKVMWTIAGPRELMLDLSAGSDLELTASWPGTSLLADALFAVEGGVDLLPFSGGRGILRLESEAVVHLLPVLAGGIDLRLELRIGGLAASTTLGIGSGGVRWEATAEFAFEGDS